VLLAVPAGMLVLVLLIAATFSPFPGVLAEDPVPYLNGATAFPRAKGLAAEQGPMASSAHGAGDGARALEVVIVMDYSSGDSRFTGMESLWSSIALPLASGGHDVTVLLVAGPEVDWAGFTFRSTARRYNGTGINIVQLPPNKHVTYSAPASVTLAYETYLWLGSRTGVDVIYFTDWGGLGYFTAAAKRQGLAFQDATIAVLLTGPRLWHAAHHGGQGGLGSLAGLESSFMERALVERADVAISSSQYMVSWFRRSGWQLPPLVYRVHPAPSRPAAAAATPDSPGGALPGEGDLPPFSEIVYFGPLEMRRGLAAFCDAVGRLIEEGARALGKHHQLQQPGRVHVAGVGAGDGSSPDGIHRYLANITFLGPDRPFLLDDGAGRVIRGRDYVMERAEGWKKLVDGTEWNIAVRFKGHLNASEALGYLAEDGEVRGHRRKLAVLPSPADSAGFGLAGVLHAGIPFLAYATGGAKELVADTDWERVLVPPSSRRLAERIIAALKDGHAPASTAQAAERGAVDAAWASWHARLAAHAEQLRGKSAIGAAFGGNREQVPGAATVGAQSTPGATGEAESGAFPTVSVVLVTFNRPWMVRQALQSILSQDYPGSLIDLVLVDDGSSDPEALALCRELEHEAAGLWFRERGWRLLRQPNGYLGAARNAGARAAVGDWILFMDDDNYAKVTEISTMVRAALRTGADIVTSLNDYLASSNTTHVPGEGDLVAKGRYIPLGGSIAVGVFNNEYGDANALIRAQALEELGGWAEDEAYGVQDWELFARAAVRGYRLEVVPEALYWYRVADGSMARELSQRINNRQLVMRPYVATGGALAELATFAQHLQIRERQLEDRLASASSPLKSPRQRPVATPPKCADRRAVCGCW